MPEWCKGRRSILLPAWRCSISWASQLIPLMLILMAVQTEQFPVAAIGRIVVVIVIFVMDRELAKLLAVKFSSATRTDPRKQFECVLSIGHWLSSLGVPCHARLRDGGVRYQTNLVARSQGQIK
jgi:hypothetical protein